jgi:glycosyltransferase involved in cell wall biosynthesis
LKAMFLGRFSEQKRIDRIIEMVWIFHNNGLKFEVDLFGRDNWTMDFVKQKVKDLWLENFIKFIWEISPNEVYNIFPNYDFYFQTSKFEWTAMSVMEAMQYWLICVVTNVWDIKNYCQDGKNSILIDGNLENFDESNLLSVITQLKKITTDINFANKLSKNAYLTWKNQKPFSESFLKALKEI